MRKGRELLRWTQARTSEARRIALRYFRSASLKVELKSDGSPVTAADRRIEEHLRTAITRSFPDEAIIGEEFGRPAKDVSTYWTLDPIDGTRAFSRGLPSWGILVSRVEQGRPMLAMCDFPAVDTTIGVAPGIAAFEQVGRSRRLLKRAPKPGRMEMAVIFHGGSHWWHGTRYERGFKQLIDNCYLERAYGDCFGYLWVLRGHADVMVDYGSYVWDLAPFAALAKATGRALLDCEGCARFTGPGSILAHPGLARRVSKLLTTSIASRIVGDKLF